LVVRGPSRRGGSVRDGLPNATRKSTPNGRGRFWLLACILRVVETRGDNVQINIPSVVALMNSEAARRTEKGTDLVRLFARLALGTSFMSAAADRFGYGGHMAQRTYPGEISLTSIVYRCSIEKYIAWSDWR